MRDKLVEILYNGFYISPKDELNGTVQKAADYLIAHGVTVQEWIPVSERLPDRTTFVLAYITAVGRSYVGVRGYVEEGKNFKMNVGETVTHWMPLPKAPKEAE